MMRSGADLLAELLRVQQEVLELLQLLVFLGAVDDLQYSAPWDGRAEGVELDEPVLLLRCDGGDE